uniref:telethonin n=1 Tax=Myxine glutinosa TaxID=7769 RepID=UPI00358E5B3B
MEAGEKTLHCQLLEESPSKLECYTALWDDTGVSPMPEICTALRESDQSRREHFERRGCSVLLTQRSPDGFMHLGRLGEQLNEYAIPHRLGMPVPLFSPTKLHPVLKNGRSDTPPEIQRMLQFETALSGQSKPKADLATLTKALPPLFGSPKVNVMRPTLYPAHEEHWNKSSY